MLNRTSWALLIGINKYPDLLMKNKGFIMEKDIIYLPSFEIEWDRWRVWNQLKDNLDIIPEECGVYEVKRMYEEIRLDIGCTEKLKGRITSLLKGTHSVGEKIRSKENPSALVIRWAITDRPEAIEKALMIRHLLKFDSILLM